MQILPRKLDFDDVLIVPKPSSVASRQDVVLQRPFKFPYYDAELVLPVIPIIAANMYNIGTLSVAKKLLKHNIMTALVKEQKVLTRPGYREIVDGYVFETYGIEKKTITWPLICLDVANGYLNSFVDTVKYYRDFSPYIVIMAGNVVTPEGAERLVEAGANIVKVGLGSGAACTTRLKTGVGYPQLSAVLECAPVIHSRGAYLCSDGGHRTPGDVAKSFVAGADFVMLGSMLAGTDETGDRLYGNASKAAQGTLEKYRAEEGREIGIPYKGTLDEVVQDLLGGLRSACTYVGASNLVELREKGSFVRIG